MQLLAAEVGVDVNRGGGLFGSPLHVATVNFDPQMVSWPFQFCTGFLFRSLVFLQVMLLIRGKADVNQTDADGRAALHISPRAFKKVLGCFAAGNAPLHVLMSVFDKAVLRAQAYS